MHPMGTTTESLPENERVARALRARFFAFLLFESVPVNHGQYPLSDMRVYLIDATLEDGQQPLAQRLTSDHPLVVVPASMMVRAIQL